MWGGCLSGTNIKQRIKCLAQGHNAVPLGRLEPETQLPSRCVPKRGFITKQAEYVLADLGGYIL